jgi:hypothetical protein
MSEIINLSLAGLAGAVLSFPILVFVAKKLAEKEIRQGEGYQAILEREYARGKGQGAKEELEKFQITYTPVLVERDSFLKNSVDAGYEMQIYYSGFPVGEPTRRITHHEEKSKDENINKVVDLIKDNLELLAMTAGKHKIPVAVNKKPSRVTK